MPQPKYLFLNLFVLSAIFSGCGELDNVQLHGDIHLEKTEGLQLLTSERKLEHLKFLNGKIHLIGQDLIIANENNSERYHFFIPTQAFAVFKTTQLKHSSLIEETLFLSSSDTGQPVNLKLNVRAKLIRIENSQATINCIIDEIPFKIPGTQKVQREIRVFDIGIKGSFSSKKLGNHGSFETVEVENLPILKDTPISVCVKIEG